MVSLEMTISKAIAITSPEVLKDKTVLMNLIEDLSPESERECIELKRIYSDALGKLLYSAYGTKDGLRNPAWKEIKTILDHEMCLKETRQEWFIQLFYKAFSNGLLSNYRNVTSNNTLLIDDISESRKVLLRLLYKMSILQKGIEDAEHAEETGEVLKAIQIYQRYSDGSCYERKAQLRLGQLYESFPKEAYVHYLRAAELGDSEAAFCVAFMSEYGEGTAISTELAITYYAKAASAGHRGAAHNLGFFYYSGNGVKKDLKRAYELFLFAAQKGKADSMRNLGVMYENGNYVKKNLDTALRWYSKAVECGNAEAEKDCQRIRRLKKRSSWLR